MRLASSILLVALLAAPASAAVRLLAVLPLDLRDSQLPPAAREALEETLRTSAGDLLRADGYTVLTGDNTLAVLADNGIDPERACEASCALELARELQAEAFVSGRVTRLDGYLVAFIRLNENQRGQQLSSLQVEAETARDLRAELERKSAELFLPLRASPAREGPIRADAPGLPPVERKEGIVSFESTPAGAIVRLDGTILCQKTPCRRMVELGEKEVVVELERHLPARQSFALQAEAVVSVALQPTFGLLDVRTDPPGLDLSLNGRAGGRSPIVLELDPDVYEVLIDHRCHLPEGERVLIEQGARRELRLTARPRQTLLRVEPIDRRGDAVGGTVLVDGEQVGRVPGPFSVPLCASEVEVRADDGRHWQGRLSLEEGRENTVEARITALHPPTLSRPWVAGPAEPVKRERDIPAWAWWTGAAGAVTWIGAGAGALMVHENLKTMPRSDTLRDSHLSTGRTLLVVSNLGATVLGAAVVGAVIQNVRRP